MRLIALSVTLALAAVFVPTAQQAPPPSAQGPTFRVEVSYVEVDAVVTDVQGKFVADLTRADFELLEDGRPQAISAFTLVDLPRPTPRTATSAVPQRVVEPDVRSNEGDVNGRIIVLVLDNLLVDARRTQTVRASARQFINRFVGDGDLVAVITTAGPSEGSQNFTSNRALMVSAVDRFLGQRTDSVATTMADAYAFNGNAVDRHAQERATRSRAALARLTDAAGYLASVRGRRKALIWFTEGLDFDVDNPQDPNGPAVREAMSQLIGTAQGAGVSFYAVDPRGIGAGLDDNAAIAALPAKDMQSDLGMRSVQNEMRWTQATMRTIATETGGFAVIGGGDLDEHFARIVEQNSRYYLLGFYPSFEKGDGKVRGLEVKVKRPGLRVQYRRGYVAVRGPTLPRPSGAAITSAPPELRAAVASPIPLAGVPMRAFAAPFRATAKNAAVAIVLEFAAAGLRFEKQGEGFNENLDVLIVPVNAAGKPLEGGRDEVPLKLSAGSYERVRANGLRLARRLDLPPGRYQLHIAAQSGNSKAIGALTYDLDVPDFSKGPLAMSGIALMSVASDRIPTPPPGKGFMDVLPITATALREFDRGDTLFTFVEAYVDTAGTPHAVHVQTTVTGEGGTVAFRRTDEGRTDELKQTRGAMRHAAKVPLEGFVPGRYVLRVEARALVSNGARALREVEFRVR